MSLPTSEEVRELIKTKVKDPELMMNIVDLGLVYDVQVTPEKTAEITMTLTSPGCPAGPASVRCQACIFLTGGQLKRLARMHRLAANAFDREPGWNIHGLPAGTSKQNLLRPKND